MTKTILFLAANPQNTSPLRLDQEVREIDNGLQRAQRRDDFALIQKWASRPKDVRRAMLDYRPNIVHFCGHGSGEEGLVFEDESGQAILVSADTLAEFFKLFADKIECVLLNACYSEVQAKAIAKYIPYVIGMKGEIGDAAAIEFAVAFYDALGAGESYEFAYQVASNALKWYDLPGHDLPVLIKRADLACTTGGRAIHQARESKYPRLYRRFIGRDAILAELMEFLADQTGRWLVGIDGMGGIGKTALASEVTTRCLESNLFEYVVWEQSSKTFSADATLSQRITYDSVLVSIAWHLGAPITKEYDLRAKERHVQALLKEQKVLVVLDNLETAGEPQDEIGARLLPLLNPSKVLMTSRFRFDQICAIHLSGFDDEEAIEFLRAEAEERKIKKIETAATNELKSIAQFVGGSPLALKLIVGQLGHLPLSGVLSRLKEIRYVPSSVGDEYALLYKNIFWPSWQLLSDESRKLLVSIALLSPDTGGSLEAIKFISNLPESTVLRCIDELWHLSFIEARESLALEETIYYLHPLTQYFVLSDVVNILR